MQKTQELQEQEIEQEDFNNLVRVFEILFLLFSKIEVTLKKIKQKKTIIDSFVIIYVLERILNRAEIEEILTFYVAIKLINLSYVTTMKYYKRIKNLV